MSAVATVARLSTRRVAWRHPEWWALALSAAAWVVMLANRAHHAHAYADVLRHWTVMSVAMMLPMVIAPMRLAAERSFWHRRHRAIAAFLVGYLGLWLVVGTIVALIPVPHGMQSRAAAIALAAAGAWQLTRWKRRSLHGCHRSMPLAPHGWRADRDCLRFGLMIGTHCAMSCWALMLACSVSGHALIVTAVVTAVGLAERYMMKPDLRVTAVVLFVTAFAFFVA